MSRTFFDWEDITPGEIEERRNATYEKSVVGQLLKLLRIPAAEIAAFGAADQLKLDTLLEHLDFPLVLLAKPLANVPSLELDLERRITKTDVYKVFCEASNELMRCVGIVFPWHEHGRFWVFHDYQPAKLIGNGRWYTVGGQLLLLQKLADLALTLGANHG